ncbi:Glutamyl-tRNA(Gln) amidotransferase subunit A [Lacunisphaera limnophila]|uniref:Glutamyl-tRNA(Gln) amidotransferase subunit A n=1 Tax=Lacunisphaera limnophila TaxID=1838286 RepID=A0A1D8AV57_9BACT|nr:amidase [Lacunisphaera limnophila]AOS44784.1 Glutamyl-tRNA(Gln) amidotransferase subunit A [Lacunisphaera limnophila]
MKSRLWLVFCCVVSFVWADFPHAEATIGGLQAQMASGQLTSVSLTTAYLERIAAVDRAGPTLHAIIELNPEALAIAQQLDAERQAGKVRGPLHGIPVLIKDNIATADQMQTTAGSLALVGAKPPHDAAIVAQLRAAGAVILGKTNLSEWANFRGEKSISGWSGRGGQTRNPYALDRNTSGSSSGSAAAAAANLCVVAVGTETDGSIVSPASVCGLVGVKPTVGLVSRTGIIPISASQDTAGPMTRTVRDAALLLEAMAAVDPKDAVTATRPAGLALDFATQLKPGALKGARLGVVRGPFGLDARLQPLLEAAIERLKAAGAEVVDLGDQPDFNRAGEPEMEVLLYEYKDGLNAYFATLGPDSPIKTLADVIAFNEAQAAQELAHFGQELMVRAQAKGPLTEAAYLEARAACLKFTRTEGIDALVAKHQLDALVSITNGPAWLIDPANGDAYTGGSSSPAAVAGYPSVTVPTGDWRGLPVGISFYGAAWTEGKLLSLAADYEAATQARREPGLAATAGLK